MVLKWKEKIKNQEGKKNDEMGELYEDNDKIFFGVIKDNIMIVKVRKAIKKKMKKGKEIMIIMKINFMPL